MVNADAIENSAPDCIREDFISWDDIESAIDICTKKHIRKKMQINLIFCYAVTYKTRLSNWVIQLLLR
jgi:hypothetical protein